MKLRYTEHALVAMFEREVSAAEVEVVIAKPSEIEAQGGWRNRYQARLSGRLIFVVVEFATEPPVVITVITPEE